MNIPIEIVCVLFTAILAGQGWVLVEVINLKGEVATLKESKEDLKDRLEKLEARE